ncbi:MAG: hypothetical protein ABMA64_39300 [Myxococcota bacterium]
MWWLAVGCAEPGGLRSAPVGAGDPPSSTSSTAPGTTPPTGTSTDCPEGPGSACDPLLADPLPYTDARDTSDSPHRAVDAYGCAPDVDEGGPEWWYQVVLGEEGLLVVGIDEVDGDGVDLDVHLLGSTDPEDCLARDHQQLAASVGPGTYWVVVDTWVDDQGAAQAGPYTLSIGFTPLAGGACAVADTEVEMFWSSCALPDCYTSGGSVFLHTPTAGPVVKEAHLVTVDDDFGGGWPGSFTDGIDDHYALSEATSGYVMARGEPWAPAGEGGSEYGQSAYGAPLPVEDEAWYVNMYWRDRPDPGTRLLLRNPANGRAVVVAGGYETGPGSNTAIGGATEEAHDWLGTGHLDELELGFLVDAAAPLGPIGCP